MKTLEVLFTPAELAALPNRDLGGTVCVVFDILRATSTIVTALANGAGAVIPVEEISEARAWRERQPGVLLAGERQGVKIRGGRSGEPDFDLGNSPREFTPEIVRGRTIVTTTTNGTRALRVCRKASVILVGSFLNLGATARRLRQLAPKNLLLVCSGTGEQAALEDALAAGALCELLEADFAGGRTADSAQMARELHRKLGGDLPGAMRLSANGRRLLALPELRADVDFCLQKDTLNLSAGLGIDGVVRKLA
jgi:2-phosphosulfolactate phosphatase